VEGDGTRAVAHVRVGDEVVRATATGREPAAGEAVFLRPDPVGLLFFDPATGRALARP
jgi:hypothetical protein